jgi:hypothetical protein
MKTTGSILAIMFILAAITPLPAAAAPVTINGITITDAGISVDERSINDAGEMPGFLLIFGVGISGGATGYSGAGIFTPGASSTAPPLTQTLASCSPTTAEPRICTRTIPFNSPGQIDGNPQLLNGTWSFEVESPSGSTATFALPSAAPIPTTPLPFPSSVTITNSASGVNPTISWTLPAALAPAAASRRMLFRF